MNERTLTAILLHGIDIFGMYSQDISMKIRAYSLLAIRKAKQMLGMLENGGKNKGYGTGPWLTHLLHTACITHLLYTACIFFFFLTEICSKINGADKNQMDVQKCRITYI